MKTTDEVRHFCGWLLGSWLLLVACQPERDKKPEGLLPQEKMVDILTEVHLAEAKVSKLGVNATDSLALVYKRLEAQIYARHKLDTAAYNRSYQYYAANPGQLAELYKQVVARLEQKKN